MSSHLETIERYLRLLERVPGDPSEITSLFHPDFRQTEFPNALNPKGQESDLQDCLRRLGIAGKILASQKYQIKDALEAKDRIVVEASWVGTMAAGAGPLKPGQTVNADFCMVFEFKDGRIHRQRNYDCFHPFS